jgi:hypothetical protein
MVRRNIVEKKDAEALPFSTYLKEMRNKRMNRGEESNNFVLLNAVDFIAMFV